MRKRKLSHKISGGRHDLTNPCVIFMCEREFFVELALRDNNRPVYLEYSQMLKVRPSHAKGAGEGIDSKCPHYTRPLDRESQSLYAQRLYLNSQIGYAYVFSKISLKRMVAAMPSDSPLVRQWILLRTLCARRYGSTVKELAEEMDVSEKTIRRDLDTFLTAGFPLEETVGDFGRKSWIISQAKHQPDIGFTFDEAIALYLGRHFLEPLAGTLFWEAAQRAFRKIRAVLGKEALKYLDNFGTMFHQTMVGTSDYSKKANLIDELMVGIEDRKAVFITYQSLRATEPVTYDVYPYGLTYHRGSLYLIGCSPQHEEIRHWKVDRIENAEVTKFLFTLPEDFNLHEHLATSFGVYHGNGEVHVKVRFSPAVARYVQESSWHKSQKLSKQKDGGVVAEFDLNSTEEIKSWILGFGRHAVVLQPESLRQEMAEEHRQSFGAYSKIIDPLEK